MYLSKGFIIFNKFFLDTAISIALVLTNKTNIFSNFNEIITFDKKDSLIDKILKINKLDIPNTDNLYSIISKFKDYTTIIITAQKLDLNLYTNQNICQLTTYSYLGKEKLEELEKSHK